MVNNQISTKAFQSTLPRGSDQRFSRQIAIRNNFNPRSLAGATCTSKPKGDVPLISIHAPSRERPLRPTQAYTHLHFNPRSLAGATCLLIQLFNACIYFNPRSLAGATEVSPRFMWAIGISIHAPSRERQFYWRYAKDAYVISIHAPSRERLIFFGGKNNCI